MSEIFTFPPRAHRIKLAVHRQIHKTPRSLRELCNNVAGSREEIRVALDALERRGVIGCGRVGKTFRWSLTREE